MKIQAEQRGFSLIELVIVLSIMTILIGIAVPSFQGIQNGARFDATQEEMAAIGAAIEAYTNDLDHLPEDLDQLYSSTESGWIGPYIDDALGGNNQVGEGYRYDSWGNAYLYTKLSTTKARLKSFGSDAKAGGVGIQEDIDRFIQVNHVFRKKTLATLAILNNAVSVYNATYLPAEPLPSDAQAAIGMLLTKQLLPNDRDWSKDAYGNNFIPSAAPLVEFSAHTEQVLQGSSSSQSNANAKESVKSEGWGSWDK